jgi:hypothetical protein
VLVPEEVLRPVQRRFRDDDAGTLPFPQHSLSWICCNGDGVT